MESNEQNKLTRNINKDIGTWNRLTAFRGKDWMKGEGINQKNIYANHVDTDNSVAMASGKGVGRWRWVRGEWGWKETLPGVVGIRCSVQKRFS